MAKYYKGINGPVSGKVGGVIYRTRNGQGIVQSLPKRSTKPPSTAQVIQRARFGLVMRFLSPVRGILNESYLKINRKIGGLQVAAKQILTEAIIGEHPQLAIDFSKVTLTRGNLRSPNFQMSYRKKKGGLKIHHSNVTSANEFVDDEVILLIYCQSLPEQWITLETGIVRNSKKGVVNIPFRLAQQEVHIWTLYRSQCRKHYSDSSYMGSWCIPKIEDHEKK